MNLLIIKKIFLYSPVFLTCVSSYPMNETFKKASFVSGTLNQIARTATSGDYSFQNSNQMLFKLTQLIKTPSILSSVTLTPTVTLNSALPIQPSMNATASSQILTNLPKPFAQTAGSPGHTFNADSFRASNTKFINKQLTLLSAHYPAACEVFKARKSIICNEIFKVIEILRQSNFTCNANTSTADILKARENWLQLTNLTVSVPELNENLRNTIHDIQKATTTTEGFYKPIKSNEKNLVTKSIQSFEDAAINWLKDDEWFFNKSNTSFDYQCLNDTQKFLEYHRNSLSYLNLSDQNTFDCSSANWDFLKQPYIPLNAELNTAILTNSKLPYYSQEALAIRTQIYDTLIQQLKITHVSSEAKMFLYTLVDHIQTEGLDSVGKFLVSRLSNDHPSATIRDLYNQIHTNGLPNFIKYNEAATKIIMDSSIGKSEYGTERELLYRLATCPIDSVQKAEQVEQSLNYLKNGLLHESHSKAYLELAHITGNAVCCVDGQKEFLHLADYTQKTASVHQEEIKGSVLNLIIDNMEELQNQTNLSNINQSQNWQVINRLDNAYSAMCAGNIQAEDYLQNALLPEINLALLQIDYDSPAIFLIHTNKIQHSLHQDVAKKTTHEIIQNGAHFELKKYEITSVLNNFLHSHALDPKKFESLYGHQLQHLIHTDILSQLQAEYQLENSPVIGASALQLLNDLTIQTTDLSRQHNTVGDVQQASMLSNFCWQMIDYMQYGSQVINAATRGVETAVIDKATEICNFVYHPIDSTQKLIFGLGNLGQTALKLVDQIDHKLGELTIGSPDKSRFEALVELNQETKAALSSLAAHAQKEGVAGIVEKTVHFGTSCVLDTALIGKSSTLLNKFATIATEGKLGQLVEKVTNATTHLPEVEAITAESISIKVGQSTEQCLLSEASQKIKPATRSDALYSITETTCPASCINQAENLKHALKIEEFTSIIKVTKHGIQRLIERGFTANETLDILKFPHHTKLQTDGAKVFIKQIENNFNVIALNETTGEIITALKNINQNALKNLGKNYGWK